MSRAIAIPGFRIDKSGRVVRDERRLSVSERLRQRGSKRIRVARRGACAMGRGHDAQIYYRGLPESGPGAELLGGHGQQPGRRRFASPFGKPTREA
jgi:hypothetical protein